MAAPERFVEWMSGNIANDKKFGRRVFRYHPRSDEHSKKICQLILEDLINACRLLGEHVASGAVVAGINAKYQFPNGKKKSLDLAIGTPSPSGIDSLRLSCEAKQTMTEHSKSKPRLFDELSSSHEIVHQGDTNAIAAGIVVLNIADRFASPLRQTSGDGPLDFTDHRQPDVTQAMVDHLGGLIMRDNAGEVGFDAFAIIVLDCDNVGACKLQKEPPAPQPGDRHHYQTFLDHISGAYIRYFG